MRVGAINLRGEDAARGNRFRFRGFPNAVFRAVPIRRGQRLPRSGKMRLSFPWRSLMRASPLLFVAVFVPLGCNRGAAPAPGGANPAGTPTVVKVARPAQKP